MIECDGLGGYPRMAKLNVIASTDPHWFDMDPDYFGMMAAVLGSLSDAL